MARPASVFAHIRGEEEREKLHRLWKEHPAHSTRARAHAVILSSEGYEIEQLANIFEVQRDTARSWIARFESNGVDGLEDEQKPGGPRKLDEDEEQILRELLNTYPSRPAELLAKLRARTGKTISRASLRRYARRFGLRWKRFRRSLSQNRDEKAFRAAQEELALMLEDPDVNVVYFDESGFSLKGVVPYGWLPTGERTAVPVSGAHRSSVQALGFLQQDGAADFYLQQGSVNSQIVIDVMDDYCNQIDGTTLVVVDNASCHTSKAFRDAWERWAERGLLVYYLPPYSPELNAIERLWKRLKYQLMPTDAWEHFRKLLNTLTEKLRNIGEVTYLMSLQNYT
jgi:transposase